MSYDPSEDNVAGCVSAIMVKRNELLTEQVRTLSIKLERHQRALTEMAQATGARVEDYLDGGEE